MSSYNTRAKSILFGGTAMALLFAAGPIATAQAGADQNDAEQLADEQKRLGTVTVTAQKREENLQDVPLSISAFSGDDLEASATQGLVDLQTSVPGLVITDVTRPGASTQVFIRGVGTAALDGGMEASVGFFVDGVYRSRSGQGIADLVDVDSVEVLRGPQGTLFGKNTSSGAIVVNTKNPTNDFEGFGEVTLGNYNLQRYKGMVNIPLAEDKAAFRLAGSYHKRDGFIDNLGTGGLAFDSNDKDRLSLNAKLLFTPSDNLNILLRADFTDIDEVCCLAVREENFAPLTPVLSALSAANGGVFVDPPRPEDLVSTFNRKPSNTVEDRGLSMEVTWGLGEVDLFSQTSFRKYETFNGDLDVDFTFADILYNEVGFENEQFSQEFRLNGQYDGFAQGVDWLVGVYYAEEDIDWSDQLEYGLDAPLYLGGAFGDPALGAFYAPGLQLSETQQSGETFAVFTHNIIDLTDKVTVVAGLRYTSEEKNGTNTPTWGTGPNNPAVGGLGLPFSVPNGWDQTFEDDAVTGTLSVSYDWTDDVSTYLSYSRGFKSGGFSFERDVAGPAFSADPTACELASSTPVFPGDPAAMLPPAFACLPGDPSFASETVDSYELGLRSILFDGALLFNATLFSAEFTDVQLAQFTGVGFNVRNAGELSTEGFEIESTWLTPVDGLEISANLAYTKAEFGDGVSLGVTPLLQNVGGQPPRNAPEWQPVLSAKYAGSLTDNVDFNLGGTFSYTTEAVSELRNNVSTPELLDEIDAYGLLSLNAGLTFQNGMSLSAFCRNCTDEREPSQRIPSPLQSDPATGLTSVERYIINPQEYGVSLRVPF